MTELTRIRILLLAAFTGCDRSPVVAGDPPAVAPAPRPVTQSPHVVAAEAVLAQVREEWKRQQALRAAGAGTAEQVDAAECAVHAAAADLAAFKRDVKGERAAREAEVAALKRRWERASELHRRGVESAETLDTKLGLLAEGRARLARFEGDKPALVREHGVLVEIAERQLQRARAVGAAGAGVPEVLRARELALLSERQRLDAAKALRVTPRRVD